MTSTEGDAPEFDSGSGVAGLPSTTAERGSKEDRTVRTAAEAKKYELSEQQQKKWFRLVMMLSLPLVTVSWLGLIAWAVLRGRIEGIQVGIALGMTGAGLLALLGLQIGWAYSQDRRRQRFDRGRAMKSVAARFRE